MNFNARRMVVLLLAIAIAVGSSGLPPAVSTSFDTSDYPDNTVDTVSVDDRNPNKITVLEDGASVEFEFVDQSTDSANPFNPSGSEPNRMALRIAPNGTDVRLLDVTWNASNDQGSWNGSNPTDGAYICDDEYGIGSTAAWCDVEDGAVNSYRFETSNYGTSIQAAFYHENGNKGYTIRHLDGYGDWQGTVDIEYLLNGERKSVSLDVDGDWDDDGRGNHADNYPFTQPRIVDVVPVAANDTVSAVTLRTQTADDVDAVYDGQKLDDGPPFSTHLDPSDEYTVMLTNNIPTTTDAFESSFGDSVHVERNTMMIYNQSVDIPRDDWLSTWQIDNSERRYMVVYGQGHGIYEELQLTYQDGRQEFILPVDRSEGVPESVDVELVSGESEVETHVFDSDSAGWTVLDTTTTTNDSVSYDIPTEYRESPYSEFKVVVRGGDASSASLSYASISGTGTGANSSDDIPGLVWVLIALVVVSGVAYRSYRNDGEDTEFSPRP